MHRYWLKALFQILIDLCGCRRPHSRAGVNARYVISCLDGCELSDKYYTNPSQPTSQSHRDYPKHGHNTNGRDEKNADKHDGPDLTNSIRILTSIFPVDQRPTGEETEPFMHKLQPILEQMHASQIPKKHQVTALYTIISGKAREVASSLNEGSIDLNTFLHDLRKKLLFDQNIQ